MNYPLIGIFLGIVAEDGEGFGLFALILKLARIGMELERIGFG